MKRLLVLFPHSFPLRTDASRQRLRLSQGGNVFDYSSSPFKLSRMVCATPVAATTGLSADAVNQLQARILCLDAAYFILTLKTHLLSVRK